MIRSKILPNSFYQQTADVLFTTINNAGIITLNRPKALNALKKQMVSNILFNLWSWETNKSVVIIKGVGTGFSAGGDLKELIKPPKNEEFTFGLLSYNANYLIANLKIPYVAIMDGIAMGSGLGLAIHGKYRIATENTVVSMPETQIGLIPDIGASYFLPRLQRHLGFYLGLTGKPIKGKDVANVGLATHFVSSRNLLELEEAITRCITDADVIKTIKEFDEPLEKYSQPTPLIKDIDYCFSAKTVENIVRRLELVQNDWSRSTLTAIQSACPLSLKLTLKALTLGINLNLWQCLEMEFRICDWLRFTGNFKEGVRSHIVDKDKMPQWYPKTLEEVNESDLKYYFDQLPHGDFSLLEREKLN